MTSATAPLCRFCRAPLRTTFVDLGMSPLCETFLRADELNRMEPFYPLRVWVCERCFLVQLQEYVSPAEIFTEYAYFSSYSTSWLKHAKDYTDMLPGRVRGNDRSDRRILRLRTPADRGNPRRRISDGRFSRS